MEKRISEHKVNTLLDAMDKKFKNLIKDTKYSNHQFEGGNIEDNDLMIKGAINGVTKVL